MKTKLFVAIAALSVIFSSCKKQEIKTTPLASIQITNAVVAGTELQFGTNAASIPNNAYTAYGILTGSRELKLFTKAAPNTVYYNQSKEFVNGGVYSLFLTGTPAAVESVFLKEENIPSHTDNVFGARVINLVTGGVPVSVNVQGNANGSFIPTLVYKAISVFKDVSAKAEEGAKTFEFRNAATGALISSLTLQDYELPRFRNITLVLAGAVGAETVIRANNY